MHQPSAAQPPGDIRPCLVTLRLQGGGGYQLQQVEAGEAAKHPTGRRTPLTPQKAPKNYRPQAPIALRLSNPDPVRFPVFWSP